MLALSTARERDASRADARACNKWFVGLKSVGPELLSDIICHVSCKFVINHASSIIEVESVTDVPFASFIDHQINYLNY